MATLKKWLGNNWDEFVAYLLTLWCALIAHALPAIETGADVSISFQVGRFLVSATAALMLTFAQEFIFPEKAETAKMTMDAKRAAKRTHLAKRFLFAMAFGFGAPGAVNTVIGYVMKLGGLGA